MTAIGSMYSVGSGAGRWRAILALIRKGREVLAHKKLPGRCCAAAAGRPNQDSSLRFGAFAACPLRLAALARRRRSTNRPQASTAARISTTAAAWA